MALQQRFVTLFLDYGIDICIPCLHEVAHYIHWALLPPQMRLRLGSSEPRERIAGQVFSGDSSCRCIDPDKENLFGAGIDEDRLV